MAEWIYEKQRIEKVFALISLKYTALINRRKFMGRRKKEAPEIHRETISFAAEHLFLQKGIEVITMDEIAKEAGYSKATLYVYFKNKEEIVAILGT